MASRKQASQPDDAALTPPPAMLPETADEAPAAEPTASSGRFPVVGIGASAGGLEAFKKMFGQMPADSGIAFILIPHLDPTHESLMVPLLAKCSAMPVVEAAEGLAVEPDRVYIIPPNKYLSLQGGILRLTGPVGRHSSQLALDLFLRSLAEDQQETAICIILSGTGAHGTLGLKEVKANGGMVMVQDPATAAYDQMPHNAVATGLADYVLPPEQMAAALVGYVRQFYRADADRDESGARLSQLNTILTLLHPRSRCDFRSYRKKMILRRIERRMTLLHLDDLSAYGVYLREHPQETNNLCKDLLISVTRFFRDPDAFELLATQVLALLVEGKEADTPFRIWIPGCATGEEAYSLGMLLMEQLRAARKSVPIQIFASDADEDALRVARLGKYPISISADVSPARLERFFTRSDEHSYQVAKPLRDVVTFAAHDLVGDPPFSKLDLISCRNVLIYLEPEVQQKVISLLHFALAEGGCLFLGPSETIGRQIDLFDVVSKKWRLYRRIGPSRPERVEFPIGAARRQRVEGARLAEPAEGRRSSYADLTHQVLLEAFAPAAVLINRKHEVLFYHGPTGHYLEMPSGEPTQDLLHLARSGLRTRLRAVIHKAVRDQGEASISRVRVKRDTSVGSVKVTVRPLLKPKIAEGLLLVIFEEDLAAAPNQQAAVEVAEGALEQQLESELRLVREDLQHSIEELEGSNEELKSSNEEMMSMNEELQSANEELETSKEELQSLNEELITVNSQLQEKVSELEAANNDLSNLLSCTDLPTIFLNERFQIMRFTPATNSLLNLIPADAGRPIGDMGWKFRDDRLLDDAAKVLRSLVPMEREIQGADGRWHLRRIVPYRTVKNRIEGVVLTFVDVTALKRAAEQSRFLATVLRDSNDAVFVHDLAGRITVWNRGAERLFGYAEAEALAMTIEQLIPPENRPDHSAMIERLRKGERLDSWESRRVCKDGCVLDVWVTPTILTSESGQLSAIASTERDVTERKRKENVLRDNEQLVREQLTEIEALYASAPIGMAALDAGLRYLRVNERLAEINGVPAEAHLGRTIHEVLPQLADTLEPFYQSVFASGEPKSNLEIHGTTAAQPGVERDWLVSYYPLKEADGRVRAVSAVVLEITDRKQAERTIRGMNAELERRVFERTAELQAANEQLHSEIGERLRAEDALRDSNVRLAAILNTAAEGIIIIDEQGVVISFNKAAQALLGYREEEVIGKSVNILMPAPYRAERDDYVKKYLDTGVKTILGTSRPVVAARKDGATITVDLSVSEVSQDGRRLFTGILRDMSERRSLEREMLAVADDNQRRMGQDLHDSVGQELTALGLMAESLVETYPDSSRPEAQIAVKIAARTRSAMKQVRALSLGLIPVEVDAEGLMAALADLAVRTSNVSDAKCTFECDAPVLVEDNSTAVHLYQIAQEAVANALKHGGPRHIHIELSGDDRRVTLRVRDDGVGIAPALPKPGGLGLKIMQYRAGLINAMLTVGPAAGGGTIVSCVQMRGDSDDDEKDDRRHEVRDGPDR